MKNPNLVPLPIPIFVSIVSYLELQRAVLSTAHNLTSGLIFNTRFSYNLFITETSTLLRRIENVE